jgi:hypothetical protein
MMERTGFMDRLRQLALVAVIVVIVRLSWEYAAPFCAERLSGFREWFRPIAATTPCLAGRRFLDAPTACLRDCDNPVDVVGGWFGDLALARMGARDLCCIV